MPIKKSELKQKWYFRGAQVFFWIVQTVVLIATFSTKEEISIFIIIDIILGFALWWAIMVGIWKLFLYIVFGGVERDAKIKKMKKNGGWNNMGTNFDKMDYKDMP